MRLETSAVRSGWSIDIEPQADGTFVLDLTVLEDGVPLMGAGTQMSRAELESLCNGFQAALGTFSALGAASAS